MHCLADALGIYRAELEEVGRFGCIHRDVLVLNLLVTKYTSPLPHLSYCPIVVSRYMELRFLSFFFKPNVTKLGAKATLSLQLFLPGILLTMR